MHPEVVAWVLDEFDEGDEQTPGVGAVHNEALQQHARDLLTRSLRLAVHEQRQQHAREEVGVGVGEAQLVGNGVQHQVARLAVCLVQQVRVDVHCWAVEWDGRGVHHSSHVQHEAVDQVHVVVCAGGGNLVGGEGDALHQVLHEAARLACAQVAIHLALDVVRQQAIWVGQARGHADLRQQVHLEVGRERVRQAHIAWEGRQDEVAHLHAGGRDVVAQGEVVLTQELREVVQQDQQQAQRACVHGAHGGAEVGHAQVGLHEAQQRQQQALIQRPALRLWRAQQARHDRPVADGL
mmetsp:Transcript_8574/g.22973  ORF Transcript_8574/g.22973 Transcript_8574/m.22973 type:complete len:294 (-) Transcript_8574:5821-6702(-)